MFPVCTSTTHIRNGFSHTFSSIECRRNRNVKAVSKWAFFSLSQSFLCNFYYGCVDETNERNAFFIASRNGVGPKEGVWMWSEHLCCKHTKYIRPIYIILAKVNSPHFKFKSQNFKRCLNSWKKWAEKKYVYVRRKTNTSRTSILFHVPFVASILSFPLLPFHCVIILWDFIRSDNNDKDSTNVFLFLHPIPCRWIFILPLFW